MDDLVLVAGGRNWKLVPREEVEAAPKKRAPVPQLAAWVGQIMSLHDLFAFIAQRHGMTLADLRGQSRSREHVRVRHLAFVLGRELFPLASLGRLGKIVERDHTTVMSGLNRGKKLLLADPTFRTAYDEIKSEIEKVGVFRPKALEAAE